MNYNIFVKKLVEQKISFLNLNTKFKKKIITDLDLFVPKYHEKKFQNFLSKNQFYLIKRPQKFNNKIFYAKYEKNDKYIIIDFYKNLIFKNNYFFEHRLKKKYQIEINKKNLNKEKIKFYNLLAILARYRYEKKILTLHHFDIFKKEVSNFNPKLNQFKIEKQKINSLFLYINKKNFNQKIDNFLNKYFQIKLNLSDLIYILKRRFLYKNSHILLLGTDGSGKTTLSKSFVKLFYYNVGYNYFGMGIDNWENSWLKKIFFKLKNNNNTISKIILLLEFFFRKVSYLYRNRWRIVFVDRILIFTYLKDTFMNKCLRLFYPKFDAIIYLHGNLKKITNRKNDTNILSGKKNILKINKVIKKLKISNKKILRIDTTKNNLKKSKKIISNYLLKNINILVNLME